MNITRLFIYSYALSVSLFSTLVIAQQAKTEEQLAYDQWLKQRFSAQHEALTPVVAVADMYYSCNKDKKIEPNNYSVKHLIVNMDRNVLAEKLVQCLESDDLQSDIALNYGLQGCFYEQLSTLNKAERQQKMQLVNQAINALSREERKKSFTHCVTDQAIRYLK